jgi:hypothetical protein
MAKRKKEGRRLESGGKKEGGGMRGNGRGGGGNPRRKEEVASSDSQCKPLLVQLILFVDFPPGYSLCFSLCCIFLDNLVHFQLYM